MPATKGTDRSLAGLRILLVEDTGVVATELARQLQKLGCIVIGPLATLAAALAAVRSDQTIDGALLDVNLRGEMVYPAAAELAERHIRFLFLTGYSREHIPPPFDERPVLEKPFGARELSRKLAEVFLEMDTSIPHRQGRPAAP
jgi:CheY-like chemotaxis protein